jgi:hypothetical protein
VAWQEVGGAITGGNDVQIDPNVHWLGTRNSAPLIIRTENGAGGPNAAAEVARFTSGATPADRRLGIGTTTPTQKLTLGSGNLLLRNANLGNDGNLYFGGITDAGQTGLRLFGGLVNGAIPAGFIDVRTTDANDGLRVRVDTAGGGTERMRITAGGNVGIAIANPTQRLQFGSGNVLLPNAQAGTNGNLYFGGTTDTGQLGMRLFGGRVNPGPGEIHAGFIDVRTDTATDGLRIRVDTNVGATERMRVTTNNIQFFVPTSGGSDVRTKTGIRQLDRVLDKLASVRGVAFSWAESPQTPGNVTGQPGIGVIAQEVEEVFPELVSTYGDHGYKAVDYSGLSGVLVEAAKELRAENETLRSRIEVLERA